MIRKRKVQMVVSDREREMNQHEIQDEHAKFDDDDDDERKWCRIPFI